MKVIVGMKWSVHNTSFDNALQMYQALNGLNCIYV